MDLESIIMLSESQTEKDKYHMISCVKQKNKNQKYWTQRHEEQIGSC